MAKRVSPAPLRGGAASSRSGAKAASRGGGGKVHADPSAPPPRSAAAIDPPRKGEGKAERRTPYAGQSFLGEGVTIAALPNAERISLRAPAASVEALSKALGVALPTAPKTSATAKGRVALWLGPDEWLVIDEAGKDPLADCAGVDALHSAVGISHRNVAFAVSGMNCEAAISAGCPQDVSLATFPVGACSRTILGKVEIVLYRPAANTFRVECWRSFSNYVWDFLTDAAKDAAA